MTILALIDRDGECVAWEWPDLLMLEDQNLIELMACLE